MKILELHYSTSWAGAERFVVDLCNELSENEDIVLCTIEDDNIPNKSYYKKELNNKIKYINLKCKTGLQLKALWRIYKIIKKEKPDIVHAHTDLLCIIIPAIFYRKAKYYHTLHTLAEFCLRHKSLKFIYKYFYKTRVRPITISEACQKSFLNLYDIKTSIKIENGRAPIKFTNQENEVKNEIENLKLHIDDKVFIHVGRCQPEKNQALLIDSFNDFLKKGYHAILILIGAAYDLPENQKILSNMQKGIYWLGLKSNVGDYLINSDFFILSSKYEGLPISLLEAISLGIIPISTPAGGVVDVLSKTEYGYIAKGFNKTDLYEQIIKAYNEFEQFDKNNLKDYFEKNFSMQHCAQRYLYSFKEINYDKN